MIENPMNRMMKKMPAMPVIGNPAKSKFYLNIANFIVFSAISLLIVAALSYSNSNTVLPYVAWAYIASSKSNPSTEMFFGLNGFLTKSKGFDDVFLAYSAGSDAQKVGLAAFILTLISIGFATIAFIVNIARVLRTDYTILKRVAVFASLIALSSNVAAWAVFQARLYNGDDFNGLVSLNFYKQLLYGYGIAVGASGLLFIATIVLNLIPVAGAEDEKKKMSLSDEHSARNSSEDKKKSPINSDEVPPAEQV